jgi:S1-C subfamily serine protease
MHPHKLRNDITITAMHTQTLTPLSVQLSPIASFCCSKAVGLLSSFIHPSSEWSLGGHDMPSSVDFSFLVFKIQLPCGFSPVISFLLDSLGRYQPYLGVMYPGQAIQILGSPFAHLLPSHFSGCTFTASISCLIGDDLLWIDTSAEYPGMQGSLVVVDSSRGQAIGLLMSTLTKKKEAAHITLVVTLREVLEEMSKLLGIKNEGPMHLALPPNRYVHPLIMDPAGTGLSEAVMSEAMSGVCLVVIEGKRWATGLIASARNGFILTVAHLFKEKEGDVLSNVRVKVGQEDRWIKARLICALKRQDLAVIQLQDQDLSMGVPNGIKQLSLWNEEDAAEGSPCFVLGFGLFGANPIALGPRVTRGNIVKRIPMARGKVESMMFITSCCVHSGASGAALVAFDPNGKQLRLLGLVTSNTKLSTEIDTLILPRLSYAIPARRLAPVFKMVNGQLDQSDLVRLDEEDMEFAQIWSLTGHEARSKL